MKVKALMLPNKKSKLNLKLLVKMKNWNLKSSKFYRNTNLFI